MPRGNLETIYPRFLVLAKIRDHLKKCEFQNAFLLMRKHRIDFNLLFDFNPSSFLENIVEFIKQIDNVDSFNLFLSQLRY